MVPPILEMIRIHKAVYTEEHPVNVLPFAVIAYKNSANKTTPYELIFGHTSTTLQIHCTLERNYKIR